MAPNLTASNLHLDIPLDLTYHPKKEPKDRQTVQDHDRRTVPDLVAMHQGKCFPQDFKQIFCEDGSRNDVGLSVPRNFQHSYNCNKDLNRKFVGMKSALKMSFIGQRAQVQNQTAPSGRNLGSQTVEKRKLAVARRWLGENMLNRYTAAALYMLLATYLQFCKKHNEIPVDYAVFFDIIRTEFSETQSEDLPKPGPTNQDSDEDSGSEMEQAASREHLQDIEHKKENAVSGPDPDSDDSGCEMYDTENDESQKSAVIQDEEKQTTGSKIDLRSREDCDRVASGKISPVSKCPSYDSGFESTDPDSDSEGQRKLDSTVTEERAAVIPFQLQTSFTDDDVEPNALFIDEGAAGETSSDQTGQAAEPRLLSVKEEPISDVDSALESVGSGLTCQQNQQPFWSESQLRVINNVDSFLQMDTFRDSPCYKDGAVLAQIFVGMLKQNLLNVLLNNFAHSMSCANKQCSKMCFMFKRIFLHLTKQCNHKCAVKNMYGHLLRLHLDTCRDDLCGLSNCKALQGKRIKTLLHQQLFKTEVKI